MSTKREIVVWECDTCHKQYPNQYLADICCKQYFCEDCGKPLPKYRLLCEECSNKRNYEKAKKMTYTQYIKKYPNEFLYFDDQYFYDLPELQEYCHWNHKPMPEYVYGTVDYRVEVDIESAIEQAEEDSNLEDFSFDNTDTLIDFVNNWNKSNGTTGHMVTNDIVIIFNDKEKRIENESD